MSTTMEAPSIDIDVTKAVLVLQAASQAGMFDPNKIPETDEEKISSAGELVKMALQVRSVVEIVGKTKVPNWPAAEEVLRVTGLLEDQQAATPPAASVPSSPPVAPPVDDWQPPAAPEPAAVPPAPDEAPSPTMSREQAENAADAAASGMIEGEKVTWAGREKFIREMSGLDQARPIEGEFWLNESGGRFKVERYEGGPSMEIRFAGSQETTSVPAGFAHQLSQQQEDDQPIPAAPPLDPVQHNPVPAAEPAGQQFDAAEVARKLQAKKEATEAAEREARQNAAAYAEAPPGVAEQGGSMGPDDDHDPNETTSPQTPSAGFSPADLVAPSSPAPTVAPDTPKVDLDPVEIARRTLRQLESARATYRKIEAPPADSTKWELGVERQGEDGVTYVVCDEDGTYWDALQSERAPYDPMANYVQSEDVPNDDGDEVYRAILDDTAEIYSPNGMPVPLDLQNPPEAMPDDLTGLNDIENRRYHSQFNALAARSKYLHDLESAIKRRCQFMLEEAMKKAKRIERADKGDQSKITLEEIKDYAKDHPDCVLWKTRVDYHESRADAWKTFFDIYTKNVTVLSRDWTMKDTEREGA